MNRRPKGKLVKLYMQAVKMFPDAKILVADNAIIIQVKDKKKF